MTPEQKNTISNYFRVSSLEDLNADTDGKRFSSNPGGPVFIGRLACDVIDTTPPPVDLWHGLWYQGEMACLFGEPNVGKTILAMRIASEIVARGESVLYFDFENAEHQLLPRYAEHSFDEPNSPRFEILTPNYYNHQLPKSNREWLNYIIKRALESCSSIIIIDDITHLFGTGDPADVRFVLNTLRSWVKQHRLSILVLAHARRRKPLQPVTLEHLAGSFECAYSFDSIFSLTRANRYYRRQHGIFAYIKQHKSRMGEVIYDDENVITASLRFDHTTRSLTLCDFMTGGNERQLLRDFGYRTRDEILQAVLQYKEKSFTICEIADHVGISKSQVGRLLKEHYNENDRPTVPSSLKPLPPMTCDPINPHSVCSQTAVDQGGIDSLLVDDDLLPMRYYDKATGKTYKYYPDMNFAAEIKSDECINLPTYIPAPGEEDRPIPGVRRYPNYHTAHEKQKEDLQDFSRSDSQILSADSEKEPRDARLSVPAPLCEENPYEPSDDDYDDDDKPFDQPWDPCAYEEPVTRDTPPEGW